MTKFCFCCGAETEEPQRCRIFHVAGGCVGTANFCEHCACAHDEEAVLPRIETILIYKEYHLLERLGIL